MMRRNKENEYRICRLITKTCLYICDPLKPHFLYSKTGVYRGIHYFPYFCSKTEAVLTSTYSLCFEQKYEKFQSFFYLKIFNFLR